MDLFKRHSFVRSLLHSFVDSFTHLLLNYLFLSLREVQKEKRKTHTNTHPGIQSIVTDSHFILLRMKCLQR